MSLIGIDVSQRMIEYAREQAEAQQVSDRVEFHTMDALLMLEFPSDFFDLANLRVCHELFAYLGLAENAQ